MDQQLSMFGEVVEQEELYIMPLEEMRKHEWVVAWSGGKDSTATIIKMHELGVPIKAIAFVLMMWDDTTPAIYPVMYEFILKAKSVFESWGYNVILQKSIKTAKERAEMVFKKSSKSQLIGKTYGARAFLGGGCTFQQFKERSLVPLKLSTEYQMIGYAYDEMERLHRLTKKKQSILVEQKIVERECFDICRQYDLLSPMYEIGLNRDGCWFCPNATEKERELVRNNYPELLENINYIISLTTNLDDCEFRNNWYKEYRQNERLKEQIKMEI